MELICQMIQRYVKIHKVKFGKHSDLRAGSWRRVSLSMSQCRLLLLGPFSCSLFTLVLLPWPMPPLGSRTLHAAASTCKAFLPPLQIHLCLLFPRNFQTSGKWHFLGETWLHILKLSHCYILSNHPAFSLKYCHLYVYKYMILSLFSL